LQESRKEMLQLRFRENLLRTPSWGGRFGSKRAKKSGSFFSVESGGDLPNGKEEGLSWARTKRRTGEGRRKTRSVGV